MPFALPILQVQYETYKLQWQTLCAAQEPHEPCNTRKLSLPHVTSYYTGNSVPLTGGTAFCYYVTATQIF